MIANLYNKHIRSKGKARPSRTSATLITDEKQDYFKLVQALDREVSRYVRKSSEIAPGVCQCYTCRKIMKSKDIQAGHFISRRYFIVRFDLRNIRPQCPGCNNERSGAREKYRWRLVEEIGEDQVKDLEALANAYGEQRIPRETIIENIKKFKEANKKWSKGWDIE